MRRALRFLAVLAFLTLVWSPVEPATAAPAGSGSVIPVAARQTTTNPTAPAGPTLNPQQQQPPNKGKQKLALGVIAALLLVIVYVGHTTRTKRRKARNG